MQGIDALCAGGELDARAGLRPFAKRLLEDGAHGYLPLEFTPAMLLAWVQALLLCLKLDPNGAAVQIARALPDLRREFERNLDELGLCQTLQLQAALHWSHAKSAAADPDDVLYELSRNHNWEQVKRTFHVSSDWSRQDGRYRYNRGRY